jgi:FAD/FMN-containing dehydrogenase
MLVSGVRRRDLLGQGACLLLGAATGVRPAGATEAPAVSTPAVLRGASFLAPEDGEVYRRQSGAPYDRLSVYYNRRHECVRPEIAIRCRSPRAVSKSIQWCRENAVAFAVRSGGHCYEGTSRSNHAVIDVRGLNAIDFDSVGRTIAVGGGAQLGDVYAAVAPAAQAVAAGTCPTVGVAGHALAGGIGFFVRQFGFACDNMVSAEIATADGEIEVADERSNPDLFWALRGAGQASFGIVTRLAFRTHDVAGITTCDLEATTSPQRCARFLARWQGWIDEAPGSVSSSVFLQRTTAKTIHVQLRCTILGDAAPIRRQLELLAEELRDGPRLRFVERSFAQTVRWFSEGEDGRPVYEKGKSDIVKRRLGEHDFAFMLDRLPPGVDADLTALGGAVDRIGPDRTAFPHRAGSSLVIQWGISWDRPEQERSRLRTLDGFYARMRPLMSASAFLNYADRDIADPARAYWGGNLERLVAVKQKYDPDNLFHHVMSVPLRLDQSTPTGSAPQPSCGQR